MSNDEPRQLAVAHLNRALEIPNADGKDYHVREAVQLLAIDEE